MKLNIKQTSELTLHITEIIKLLKKYNENNYLKIFEKAINSEINTKTISNILSLYQGGMASFNDLVLQNNYSVNRGDNNKLSSLRSTIYSICCNIISINETL